VAKVAERYGNERKRKAKMSEEKNWCLGSKPTNAKGSGGWLSVIVNVLKRRWRR